jgi:hypothetical protein
MSLPIIDERTRNTIEIGVALQREPRPLGRKRAARAACPAHSRFVILRFGGADHDHRQWHSPRRFARDVSCRSAQRNAARVGAASTVADKGSIVAIQWLRGLNIGDGDLSGSAVFLGVENDLLTLVETLHAGTLESGGVHKHVLAAIVRLNEAEASLTIVEFYGARVHGDIPSLA